MSSAIYLEPERPIHILDWTTFCREHGILFAPRVVGRNVFYADGREVDMRGVIHVISDTQIEIQFGEPNHEAQPIGSDGMLDVEKIVPPARAYKVTVSTFYGGANLQRVADVAKLIAKRWSCEITSDPELTAYLETARTAMNAKEANEAS